jgi:hypothetical protein
MNTSKFLNISFEELIQKGKDSNKDYMSANPFPSGYYNDFFNPDMLKQILEEFPKIGDKGDIQFKNENENKLATKGEYKFGEVSTQFAHFMNSQPMLEYLEHLTGIKNLIPDPTFEGGGFHEIKPGGFLKLHADFNKHRGTNLDRRLNVLVYLNENWEESYGGHFELWDKDMKGCQCKILPLFNRMAIFSTTDFSFHGHPDKLTCPEDRSRKSMAFYYYTNGRPASEINAGKENMTTTTFVARDNDSAEMKRYNAMVTFLQNVLPPFVIKTAKSILNRG